MMRRNALLTSALALGLLMLGAAAAQDDSLECVLFGCDDGGSEETSGDSSSSGGEAPADEPADEVEDLALPDAASDRAVEMSAGGLDAANEAREDGRGFGQSRAGR